jgi:post-segregation antitoxin (ccd killing protein)
VASGLSVYTMRMARVNVYLPDELAREARASGLNISKVTQEALSSTLAHDETDRWLDRLDRLPRADISHKRVIEAIDEARAELGDRASA